MLSRDRHAYFQRIARARNVIRRVFRIIDECARGRGLDSLQHQALIQIFGTPKQELPVSRIGESLDIVQPVASRLVKGLAKRGLVERHDDSKDQRVKRIRMTTAGRTILRRIEGDVHLHVGRFGDELTQEQRKAVMSIFAFYVGLKRRFDA